MSDGPLKKGQVCLARYSAEPGKWFRAKVLELPSETNSAVEVLHIDYGNTERVPLAEVHFTASVSYSVI